MIVLFILFSYALIVSSNNILLPDVKVVRSWILDKEKRELFKNLKVKTETEIIKRTELISNDSISNKLIIYKNYFDENGNQTKYQVYSDTIASHPRYEETYITDEMGNIKKGYREGKIIGEQEFDDEGRITELIDYNEKGDVEWGYKYEYDNQGNNTLELQYLYEKLVDTVLHCEYNYITIRDQKLLKSKIVYPSVIDRYKIIYEYEYDSLGRNTAYKEIDANGNIYYERYNNYSLFIGYASRYDKNGSLYIRDSLKINHSGEIIEKRKFNKDYKLEKIYYNEYDSDEQLLSEEIYSPDNKLIIISKYDKLGHRISFKQFENDILNFISISEYLINGLIIKSNYNDYKNNKIEKKSYEYEFYWIKNLKG